MKKQTGFTLIELMITVVIIGILVSFAFTSYQGYVLKSNRAEAKTELLNVATRFQRCYTLYGKYNSDDCAVYTSLEGDKTTSSEGRGFYKINLVEDPDDDDSLTTLTLQAIADKLPQTGDKKGVDCTTLTLTHTGAKTPAECW